MWIDSEIMVTEINRTNQLAYYFMIKTKTSIRTQWQTFLSIKKCSVSKDTISHLIARYKSYYRTNWWNITVKNNIIYNTYKLINNSYGSSVTYILDKKILKGNKFCSLIIRLLNLFYYKTNNLIIIIIVINFQ